MEKNDINCDHTSGPAEEFAGLTNELYEALVNYREALKAGDQKLYDAAWPRLESVLVKTYIFSEKYKYKEKEMAGIAAAIVNQFNEFTEPFNAFASSEDRMSAEAQAYAFQAEAEYRKLVDIVVRLL